MIWIVSTALLALMVVGLLLTVFDLMSGEWQGTGGLPDEGGK